MTLAAAALRMPYPGLRPFEIEDHPLFFGREAQVGAVLRQLEEHRFIAVVGSSGSGKSSLMRAGLLPALQDGFLLGESEWQVLVMKPGPQPYRVLAGALAKRCGASPDEVLAQLCSSDRGFVSALRRFGIPNSRPVFLLVDQFEELFAFRRASGGLDEVATRDESSAFVSMLLHAASFESDKVWVGITMRSDFIGDCEAFLGLPEIVSRSQFLVPRLDRGQMDEAISRPASATGVAYHPFGFERGLVNRIINDAGDRPDQLPLMQHALMRTWKIGTRRVEQGGGHAFQLTHDDYRHSGGIESALSRDAQAAYDSLDAANGDREVARRLFLLLSDVSPDGQITRRRPRVAEVLEVAAASIEQLQRVVETFQVDDRNFLLPPAPPAPRPAANAARQPWLTADTRLDVSHEALLRRWELLSQTWQEDERQDAAELKRLAEAARLQRANQGGFLNAKDLSRIGTWETRASAAWSRRYVPEGEWQGVLSYIQSSRKDVERAERVRRNSVITIVTILFLGIVATTAFWLSASRAKSRAEQALIQSYVRTLRESDNVFDSGVSSVIHDTLWEVATLGRQNDRVRTGVIAAWFADQDSVAALELHTGAAMRAALGLNGDLRAEAARQAESLIDRLVAALARWQQTDEARLQRLSVGVVTAAPLLTVEATAPLAARLEPVLDALPASELASRQPLLRAYVALAKRLPEPQYAKTVASLTDRLSSADASASNTRERVALAFSVLMPLVNRAQAERFVAVTLGDSTDGAGLVDEQLQVFLEIEEKFGDTVSARPIARALLLRAVMESRSYAPVVSQLSQDERLRARLLGRVAEPDIVALLRSRIQRENSPLLFYMNWRVPPIMSNLAARLGAEDRRRLAQSVAEEITRFAAATSNSDARHYGMLADSLAVLCRGIADACRPLPEAAAEQGLVWMTRQRTRLPQIGGGVPVILGVNGLLALQRETVARRQALALLERLGEPDIDEGAGGRSGEYGLSFTALRNFLTADELGVAAASAADALLGRRTATGLRSLDAYGEIAGLAPVLPIDATDRVFERVVQTMLQTTGGQSISRSRMLAALGTRASPRAVDAASDRLIAAINADTSTPERRAELASEILSIFSGTSEDRRRGVAARAVPVLVTRLRLAADSGVPSPSYGALAEATGQLLSWMEPAAAVEPARRAAIEIVRLLGLPKEQTTDTLAEMGMALVRISEAHVPGTPVTRAVGLANATVLLGPGGPLSSVIFASSSSSSSVFGEEPVDSADDLGLNRARREARRSTARTIDALDPPALINALKWPFSVGELEKRLLTALEKKSGKAFNGDVWQAADQAGAMGVTDIAQPAQRPSAAAALTELQGLGPASGTR